MDRLAKFFRITSYNVCYTKLLRKYKNQIVVLDDQRMVMAVAAITLGMSVNETDPVKLEAIKNKLRNNFV